MKALAFRRGAGLFMATLVLRVFNPGGAFTQTADYGLEEVAAQEEAYEGMPGAHAGGSEDLASTLIPGSFSSIGSARTGVRSMGSGNSAMLRYDQHREITPPEYATLRLGPLYSDLGISQSIGYRYTRLSGTGVDYLQGHHRGDVIKGGSEFPMVSGLTLNNYLIITRKMDLQANISVNYFYYPMETQEDDLEINLTDEGIFATFSTQFTPSKFSKLLLYDDILYRTDYIDTRGLSDRYGGRKYKHLSNTLGADWDWKPRPFDSFSASASRQDSIPFDDEFKRQEYVRYAEMVSYRRSLTPFAAAGLLGSASQSFYADNDRPDVYIYGISAFTGVRLMPQLTGDASLGGQTSTQTGGLLTSDRTSSGMTASLGLEHEISATRRQRLSWQRMLTEPFDGGVDMSDLIGYNLHWSGGLFPGAFSTRYSLYDPQDENRNGYADWTTALSLQHQLTRLVKLAMNVTYSMRMSDTIEVTDALGADDSSQPDLTSDYETLTLSISTGFQLTPKTRLTAYASHADRTSDNPEMVYTRDTVGVDLVWAHKF